MDATAYEKHAVATIDGKREVRTVPDNDAVSAWMRASQAEGHTFYLDSIESVPKLEGRTVVVTTSRLETSSVGVELAFEVPGRGVDLMVAWDTRVREAGVELRAFQAQDTGATRLIVSCP